MCSPRGTVKRMENKPQTGTKISANHIYSKGIVLNINKEPSKINKLEKTQPNKKFLGKMIRHYGKEDIQMENKVMQK